ncbi:MAG TPA: hypothetical protein VIK72_10345 [Clostridiaceae bacterium]
MLIKLIKYEIKACYTKFVAIFSLYIILAAVAILFLRDKDFIIQPFFAIAIIALAVITAMTLFQRFNSNLFNTEGYLMFTLPCEGNILLLSKLLTGIIWIGALLIIVVPSALLAYTMTGNNNLMGLVDKVFNHNGLLLGLVIIVYFIELILSILVIFLSISVSKLSIWRKFGVLAGFATYFIIDILNGVFVLLFTGKFRSLGSIGSVNSTDFQIFTVKSIIIQGTYDIALCILIFYAIAYLMDRKISLK